MNKHCKVLVSCSDREIWNFMELNASSWICIQAHEPACELMELHASLSNYMKAYVTACKLIQLHA